MTILAQVTQTATLTDSQYAVLTRARGRCAICSKRGADTAAPVVPVSYGGATDERWNLQPAHERCARLRHQIEGNSAAPDEPEGLRHLLAVLTKIGKRRSALDVLHEAALSKQEGGRHYDSVYAAKHAAYMTGCVVGWDLRREAKPDALTDEEWEYLCSSEAWGDLYSNAYGLLPADGR